MCIERYQPKCFKINNEDGIGPSFDTVLACCGIQVEIRWMGRKMSTGLR
jgi:hypothetical protein